VYDLQCNYDDLHSGKSLESEWEGINSGGFEVEESTIVDPFILLAEGLQVEQTNASIPERKHDTSNDEQLIERYSRLEICYQEFDE
jgi:hypothetical protein